MTEAPFEASNTIAALSEESFYIVNTIANDMSEYSFAIVNGIEKEPETKIIKRVNE